ncbi:MAG: hypothetical protein QHH15_00360 [Candidatus Thermoplasmatota archaeon]|nr:hypothetical protein [Candidatus Thermoplasmatota archaeon]
MTEIIPDEKERMKMLKDEEGWKAGDERIEFDEFFPDFNKDIGKTILGLYVGLVHLKRKKDGKLFDAYIIKTNEKNKDGSYRTVAIKDYYIVAKELNKAKVGDGVKITYEGRKDKEKEEGFYHSFIVMRKLFEPDEKIAEQPKTLVDNDDPEAMTMIEHYKELFKSKNHNKEPTATNIIMEMAHDKDLTSEEQTRIKKQLAEMIKRGDIKE